MNHFEIPVGDEQLGFREYFPGNPANDTTEPVDVFVYREDLDTWCSLSKDEDMDGYLIQAIKAVPTDKPIHLTDPTDDIEVGDVFALDEDRTPNMMRVEYFEDPKPKIVLIIEKGCIVNGYSLTGDSSFAYAVIDLDNQEVDDDGNDMPAVADVYVVDGTANSIEQIISEF